MITANVIKELKKQGVEIVSGNGVYGKKNPQEGLRTKTETIDMTKYRSPVLTENQIRRLHELTGEILIPTGTVITPKALELIKEKQISIVFDR
jgi:ethanolamine utilization cobalamin adenosyltransferase